MVITMKYFCYFAPKHVGIQQNIVRIITSSYLCFGVKITIYFLLLSNIRTHLMLSMIFFNLFYNYVQEIIHIFKVKRNEQIM